MNSDQTFSQEFVSNRIRVSRFNQPYSAHNMLLINFTIKVKWFIGPGVLPFKH